MNTFENLKKLIAIGKKTDEEIISYMDVFLMNNRITAEQYNELMALMGYPVDGGEPETLPEEEVDPVE